MRGIFGRLTAPSFAAEPGWFPDNVARAIVLTSINAQRCKAVHFTAKYSAEVKSYAFVVFICRERDARCEYSRSVEPAGVGGCRSGADPHCRALF
jgi:hypothetical protein